MTIVEMIIQLPTEIPDTPKDAWAKAWWIISAVAIVIWGSWDKIKDFLNSFLTRKHELKKIEIEQMKSEGDKAKENLSKRITELVLQCKQCENYKGELEGENFMLKQKIANIKTGFDFLYILCVEAFDDNPKNKKLLMKYKEYIDDANVE